MRTDEEKRPDHGNLITPPPEPPSPAGAGYDRISCKGMLERKIRSLRQQALDLEVIRDTLPTQMNPLQDRAFRLLIEEATGY